jgi:hypothetical protein
VRSPAARPAESPRATPLGLVLEFRSDFGFERLLEFEFTNDRQGVLDMNEGLGISAGVSFLPLAGGRFATRASAGVKAARLRADNGKALFTAFPVELMQVAYLGPLRLGAGAAVLIAPRVRGDGDLENVRIEFDPAPGAVVDVEWIVSARTRTGIGVRGSWHRFASSGTVREAPAVGLVIRADFDLLGR